MGISCEFLTVRFLPHGYLNFGYFYDSCPISSLFCSFLLVILVGKSMFISVELKIFLHLSCVKFPSLDSTGAAQIY